MKQVIGNLRINFPWERIPGPWRLVYDRLFSIEISEESPSVCDSVLQFPHACGEEGAHLDFCIGLLS